jgi:hypothetical protein
MCSKFANLLLLLLLLLPTCSLAAVMLARLP